MKKNMHGYVTILVKMDIYVKFCEVLCESSSEKPGGRRAAWLHRVAY